MELILYPLLWIIFTAIGWFYLLFRFRNLARMQKEVDEKFNGQYAKAGRRFGFYVVVASCLGLLAALWGMGIFTLAKGILN